MPFGMNIALLKGDCREPSDMVFCFVGAIEQEIGNNSGKKHFLF